MHLFQVCFIISYVMALIRFALIMLYTDAKQLKTGQQFTGNIHRIEMNLLAAGIIVGLIGSAIAVIEDDYKKEGIIPDVLDKAPTSLLQISYNNKKVQYGKELTPAESQNAPQIEWNLDASNWYTLVMNDPDAPSRQNPELREILHWMIVNIPGNDFAEGHVLAEYLGPAPPKDSGLHRYIVNVYKQSGKINFDENPTDYQMIASRMNFALRKFAAKYNLGDPLLGNMFQAQYHD